MRRRGWVSCRVAFRIRRRAHNTSDTHEARVAHVMLCARSAPEGVCRQGEEQNGHGRDVHGVVGGGDVPVEVALYLLLRDAERRALGHVLVEMAAAHDGRGAQQRGGVCSSQHRTVRSGGGGSSSTALAENEHPSQLCSEVKSLPPSTDHTARSGSYLLERWSEQRKNVLTTSEK